MIARIDPLAVLPLGDERCDDGRLPNFRIYERFVPINGYRFADSGRDVCH